MKWLLIHSLSTNPQQVPNIIQDSHMEPNSTRKNFNKNNKTFINKYGVSHINLYSPLSATTVIYFTLSIHVIMV